ncbi:hypothetical protein VF21_10290 [Pseudogymnoascus sp. 05NY08]|nr:hypothetical protein VF21_10290 [Pseudogymnoascus sp. 05NY08]
MGTTPSKDPAQAGKAPSTGGASKAPSTGGAPKAPTAGAPKAPSTGGAPKAPSTGDAPKAPFTGGASKAPSTAGGAPKAPSTAGATQSSMPPPPRPNTRANPSNTRASSPSDSESSESATPAKRRKLNAALQTTEPPVKLGVNGVLPPNTYSSLGRMTDAFGLKSTDQFTGWIESKAFTRFFSILKDRVSLSDVDPAATSKGKGKGTRQGPTLGAVIQTINEGEGYGLQKFSAQQPDVDDFTDIDWYSLCLFQMTVFNMKNRQGIFYGVKMSMEEAFARLWHAMLRATHNSAPSRHQQSDTENERDPAANTSVTAVSSTASAADLAAAAESSAVNQGNDVEFDEFAAMKKTMDPKDPFNLETRYGQYMTIYSAVKSFGDPVRIQTPFVRQTPAPGEEADLDALNEESIQWYKDLEKGSQEDKFNSRKATDASASTGWNDYSTTQSYSDLTMLETAPIWAI